MVLAILVKNSDPVSGTVCCISLSLSVSILLLSCSAPVQLGIHFLVMNVEVHATFEIYVLFHVDSSMVRLLVCFSSL